MTKTKLFITFWLTLTCLFSSFIYGISKSTNTFDYDYILIAAAISLLMAFLFSQITESYKDTEVKKFINQKLKSPNSN